MNKNPAESIDSEEYGMSNVGAPKKFVPNKVEEGQNENEVIIN